MPKHLGYTDTQAVAEWVDQHVRAGHDLRQVAADVATSAQSEVSRLNADSRITDAARAQDIAEVRALSAARRAALGAAYQAGLRSERESIATKLSRPGAEARNSDPATVLVSYRDATDRALRTSEDPAGADGELGTLFKSARRTGDALLERATLATAIDRQDVEVMEAWLDAHPGDERDLVRLADLDRTLNDTATNLMVNLEFVGPGV